MHNCLNINISYFIMIFIRTLNLFTCNLGGIDIVIHMYNYTDLSTNSLFHYRNQKHGFNVGGKPYFHSMTAVIHSPVIRLIIYESQNTISLHPYAPQHCNNSIISIRFIQ